MPPDSDAPRGPHGEAPEETGARRPRPAADLAELPDDGDLDTLLDLVRRRYPEEAAAVVRRAYETAEAAHAGQRRVGGEAYVTHPLAVAIILAHMGLDPATLAAALLHDVVEDTPLEQEELESRFGVEVARLVDGTTKIRAIEAKEKAAIAARLEKGPKEPSEAENLRRMLLASVDDLRVILIKMADRLHNMRTLQPLSDERRRRLAEETLEIYAPLANRLGIWQVKSEFEDRALQELHPEEYQRIESELSERRSRHEMYLATVIQQLGSALGESDIRARISGRAKHFYSIYRKMQRKDLGTDEIYDVLAVRLVVPRITDCYLALGIVHAMWPPMPDGFDDYIAKQKNNLYQSLHTTVYGPENRLLEIQIRTEDMHEVAEHGVAAHWIYKEDSPRAREIEEKIGALRRLIKSHGEEAIDADAFVEGLKTDVFRDQVYVFTPAGDVKELPAGSTPVDFAYQVHTEVGHRCRGALVNGRMVALDHPLRTGDTVKIITAKGAAAPSRDWLNPALGFVASSRARVKIKQWYRRQHKQDAIRAGRDVLERQLRKLGLTRLSLEDAAAPFGYDALDEFLAALGRHEVPSEAIAARLLEMEEDSGDTRSPEQPPSEAPAERRAEAAGVQMRGADDVYTRVARCCEPVPGEEVVGYITRGRGVTLHRRECPNIARRRESEPERFIRVSWQRKDEEAYPVELRITAYDRAGLVRDISDVIARRGISMTKVHAQSDPVDGMAMVTAIVRVRSYADLSGLIDKIETVDNVIQASRNKA